MPAGSTRVQQDGAPAGVPAPGAAQEGSYQKQILPEHEQAPVDEQREGTREQEQPSFEAVARGEASRESAAYGLEGASARHFDAGGSTSERTSGGQHYEMRTTPRPPPAEGQTETDPPRESPRFTPRESPRLTARVSERLGTASSSRTDELRSSREREVPVYVSAPASCRCAEVETTLQTRLELTLNNKIEALIDQRLTDLSSVLAEKTTSTETRVAELADLLRQKIEQTTIDRLRSDLRLEIARVRDEVVEKTNYGNIRAEIQNAIAVADSANAVVRQIQATAELASATATATAERANAAADRATATAERASVAAAEATARAVETQKNTETAVTVAGEARTAADKAGQDAEAAVAAVSDVKADADAAAVLADAARTVAEAAKADARTVSAAVEGLAAGARERERRSSEQVDAAPATANAVAEERPGHFWSTLWILAVILLVVVTADLLRVGVKLQQGTGKNRNFFL